jgi:hypothetical protein
MIEKLHFIKNNKLHSVIVGTAVGSALYHYCDSLGFGTHKEAIAHISPLIAFVVSWIWAVIYQETFARLNKYRLKRACQRRMKEIKEQLSLPDLLVGRRNKLQKEYDECIEFISRASKHDLLKRMEFVTAG